MWIWRQFPLMPYDVYFRFSVGHSHKTLVLKIKHNKIRKRRSNYKIRMVKRKNVGKKKKKLRTFEVKVQPWYQSFAYLLQSIRGSICNFTFIHSLFYAFIHSPFTPFQFYFIQRFVQISTQVTYDLRLIQGKQNSLTSSLEHSLDALKVKIWVKSY